MAKSLLQELFDGFPAEIRGAIMAEAGVAERGIFGNVDVRVAPERIMTAVLRRTSISDEQFTTLRDEFSIPLEGTLLPTNVEIKVALATRATDGIAIGDLTAASAVVWEVAARVASILNVLSLREEELAPPLVKVSQGSVSFSLGGSTLLTSGVAFVILSHTRMLPQDATLLTYYGGALLVSVGLIDLAVNWYKSIREAIRVNSETQLNGVKLRQAELELARQQNQLTEPPSALVSQENMEVDARRLGIALPLAAHLLNRVLPAMHNLTVSSGQPSISVSSTGGASATRTASASS